MTFDEVFERVIGHEGGYVNDPQDPGGETKFGISKRSHPNWDINAITIEQAKEIYRNDFWLRAKCDEYDPMIGFQLFDAAVNSGIGNAIRFLQRAVDVADDGWVGPVTVQAIRTFPPTTVVLRFNAERLDFLTKLTTWDRFGRGWARRVAENLRYAASD